MGRMGGSFSVENLIQFAYLFPMLLISVALHEFAHCLADYRLGDPTAKHQGRYTLNPLAHLEPMGTAMMAISAFFGFGIGWGKPTPFDPSYFRNPVRDSMISALAGPFSNVLQMLGWTSLLLITVSLCGHASPEVLLTFCSYGIWVNGFLAAFNLFPIYPLDGHFVLAYFAPPSWRPIIQHRAWGVVFIALVMIEPLREHILWPIVTPIANAFLQLSLWMIGGNA